MVLLNFMGKKIGLKDWKRESKVLSYWVFIGEYLIFNWI